MSKRIKVILAGLLAVSILALGISLSALTAQNVMAATEGGGIGCPGSISCPDGASAAKSNDQSDNLTGGEPSVIETIIDAALFIIGAASVLVLIYGCIRYITSGGNSTSITAAKNMILYAIISIIVALLAFAIVNLVFTSR